MIFQKEPQTSDPFVMYQVYKKLRSTLNDAVYSEDLTQLTETSQVFYSQFRLYLL